MMKSFPLRNGRYSYGGSAAAHSRTAAGGSLHNQHHKPNKSNNRTFFNATYVNNRLAPVRLWAAALPHGEDPVARLSEPPRRRRFLTATTS